MTAQMNDVFRYDDTDFSVAGISGGVLFEPSLLDLKPVGPCTACWRGYKAIFAVSDSHLVLDTLNVNLPAEGKGFQRQEGPSINGVTPTGSLGEFDSFNNHYTGLKYHLEYTGGLLLADGFIAALYVHMGFHPAWKYRHVLELIFEHGVLKQEFDRSERMAELRQQTVDSHPEDTTALTRAKYKIREHLEGSFDRRYRI